MISLHKLNTQRARAGTKHVNSLREHPVVHKIPHSTILHSLPGPQVKAHNHCLGSSLGLIQQRGSSNVHPCEAAYHGLKVQQGLQTALRDLSLIGGIGCVPGGIFQYIPTNHRGKYGAVVPLSDKSLRGMIQRQSFPETLQILGF